MNQRDWADKDYYRDLGVSSSASAAEIKRAYRKLARENHPDNHPGDAAAEERFKRAAEAYDVVGDENKRKEYDQLKALLSSGGFGGKGRSGFPGGFRKEAGEFHFDDIFGSGAEGFGGDGGLGDIFGSFINRGGGSRRAARPSRGADISTEVTLNFREAVEGTTLPLSISGTFTCDHCHGTGSASGKQSICPDCHGSGFTSEERGAFGFSRPCASCNGTGEKITDPCTYCHGTGSTNAAKKISIKIPPGAEEGQRLRVKRKGQAGPPGTPPGDLLVGIKVRPDSVFTRSGKNLEVEVPVSFAELALGGEIVVPTLTDPVRLKVPAGTGNGRKLRLKGRGVPAHGSKPAGDLLVTVNIKVPTHLDDTARTALRTYAQAERDSGFSPRP